MTRREALTHLRDALTWTAALTRRRVFAAAAAAVEVYLSEQPSNAPAGVIVLAERRKSR